MAECLRSCSVLCAVNVNSERPSDSLKHQRFGRFLLLVLSVRFFKAVPTLGCVFNLKFTLNPTTVEGWVYWQWTVLCLLAYNMNALGHIVLVFAPFCRYWSGLHIQVKTCLLILTWIIMKHKFSENFFGTPPGFSVDSGLLCCDILEVLPDTNTDTIDTEIGIYSRNIIMFIYFCNRFNGHGVQKSCF